VGEEEQLLGLLLRSGSLGTEGRSGHRQEAGDP